MPVINYDYLKKTFEACRSNISKLESGVEVLNKDFTEDFMPDWIWRMTVKGNYQNRPYIEVYGSNEKYNCYASISFKFNVCNKKGYTYTFIGFHPNFFEYNLDWGKRFAVMEPWSKVVNDFIVEKIKLDKDIIKQLCKIMEDFKTENDINKSVMAMKSFIAEYKIKKDFK